jgi:glucose/mannose-6-phosphate isomerase
LNRRDLGLDDPTALRKLDPDGMLDRLHEFPDECGRALDMAKKFVLPDSFREVERIVVIGMGGSAIGGDLVASLAEAESPVPIQVYRGYHLPAYVDSRTLVVASSYSGNTEETLTCFEQSLARGALNLAITTGGRLLEVARARSVPTFTYNYQAPPRAAFPYGFVTLLCFMQRLGFLTKVGAGIEDIPSLLRSQTRTIDENCPEPSNIAKQTALFLHRKFAVIYGAELLTEVAHRWKTQINENSKSWALYEILPEMNHNSVVGYEFPSDLKKDISVVMVVSQLFSERIRIRLEVVRRLLTASGIAFKEVAGLGDTAIAQVMSLVLLGDYVSYYLAILNGTEPGPVRTIDYLKAELGRREMRQ